VPRLVKVRRDFEFFFPEPSPGYAFSFILFKEDLFWNKMVYNVLFLLFLVLPTFPSKILTWYNGIYPPLGQFPWKTFTHVRFGGPLISSNGTATCNHTQMDLITQKAHAHNVSILWADNVNHSHLLDTPDTYWNSIGNAVKECKVDGITVDYEHTGPFGIVTEQHSTMYSHWLSKLRKTIQKPVGADISLPGLAAGNWMLGWLPCPSLRFSCPCLDAHCYSVLVL